MDALCTIIDLFVVCLFGRIVLSWFPLQPGGLMAGVHDFLMAITEPVLSPIRRLLPPVGMGGGMGFDLSPLILLLALQLVVKGLVLGC